MSAVFLTTSSEQIEIGVISIWMTELSMSILHQACCGVFAAVIRNLGERFDPFLEPLLQLLVCLDVC